MTQETFPIKPRVHAYRSNIKRYRQLLATELTDGERSFLDRRLAEDRLALDALTGPARAPAANRAATYPAGRLNDQECTNGRQMPNRPQRLLRAGGEQHG